MFRRALGNVEKAVVRVGALHPTLNTHVPSISFGTCLALQRSKFRHSRNHIPVLFELWRRREEVGPEKPKHRSEFPNWNYEAELFGFSKRLNEEWQRETLVKAFTEKEYAEAESQRRAKLSQKLLDEGKENQMADASIICNTELATRGEQLCQAYITRFLHRSLPNYPKDGVKSVCDFLLSDEMLAYVSKNLGTADLILSTEFPASVSTLANVFKALVGGLDQDQGPAKASTFVHDFLITQLSGRDINQFWKITNPMGLLVDTMKQSGNSGDPEARIIWQTGVSTPLAAYKVGIYDSTSKKLMGQGGGETVMIAEEMAALDALYRLFGTHDWRVPFEFGREARSSGITETIVNQQ